MASFAASERQMVGSRGAGYGLDAELARKREAQYDFNAETKAREWIEQVTGEAMPGAFGESLKDGVLLCKLINIISPGAVKRINNSQMPFKQMENISAFLKACRAVGVAEHSLFETVDLYEEKDLGLVVQCLFALGSTVQTTVTSFQGPHLGARLNQQNRREWTDEQIKQGRLNAAYTKQNIGSAEVMERIEVKKTGITMGAEYAGIGDTSVTTQWSQGSYGIMDRAAVSTANNITFGAESAGVGDASVATQWSQGSYGIMDRPAVSTANSITFGAENAGIGNAAVAPQWSQGSYGIMDRPTVSRANNITFGADSAGTGSASAIPKSAMGSAGIMERGQVSRANDITFGAQAAGKSLGA